MAVCRSSCTVSAALLSIYARRNGRAYGSLTARGGGLPVGVTVERVRQQFVEDGLEAALQPPPRKRVYERRLDGKAEAHLVALACGSPPEGRARWTLRLLANRMVALEYVEELSYETVRRTLKKTSSSRG